LPNITFLRVEELPLHLAHFVFSGWQSARPVIPLRGALKLVPIGMSLQIGFAGQCPKGGLAPGDDGREAHARQGGEEGWQKWKGLRNMAAYEEVVWIHFPFLLSQVKMKGISSQDDHSWSAIMRVSAALIATFLSTISAQAQVVYGRVYDYGVGYNVSAEMYCIKICLTLIQLQCLTN